VDEPLLFSFLPFHHLRHQYSKEVTVVVTIEKRFVMALSALVMAALLVTGLMSTAVTTQAQPAPATDLEIISEMTGYLASETAVAPDCFFSDEYQVYLCEQPAPAERPQSNPAARAEAMSLLTSGGALFIINSTAKQLMVFDPVTGDLVDEAFIMLDDDATGTAIHALIGPNNTILISDQIRDIVHEYDLDGNYLGVFAPIGGANTDILDNIRGMALRPNGNLLVTVASSANANSIAEFDPDGNYLGNFIDNGSGGLNSPFDVYERPSVDWLVSSINNNQVLSYEWANGDPIGQFAPISSFPQQIYDIDNGNVLVANFSGTVGVHEFQADGTPVGVYNPAGVSGNRGVYQLPNGNILTSSGGGVFEIDRDQNLVETKYSGVARFIQYVFIENIDFNKTVGLDSSACATTSEISVAPDTAVTYCFEVTNNTTITLTQHDLIDSHLGVILDDFSFTLTPGASIFLTQTAVITATTVNTATWTATGLDPADVYESTDTATVNVIPPSIALSKTVGTDPSACADTDEIGVAEGTTVTYCYEVTNTGLTTLAFHDLDDSELGEILDGLAFNLEPGASAFITATAFITEATVNTALWTAYNAGPTDVVTATDSATVNILTPAISLAKTVGVDPSACATTSEISVAEGTAVTYCYEVTNTGEVSLSLHDVEDSELGDLLTAFNFVLEPGASVFITETAVITQPTTNTATWTAYNPGPYAVATDSDSATVNILPAGINLVKTVGLDSSACADTDQITVASGTAVTYCYTVTNTGDVPLTVHDLTDSHLGSILDGFAYNLEPGASVFLTQTAVITQTTTNIATWTAYNPGPYSVATDTDSATVTVEDQDFLLYLPVILRP
jgi:hypothetical protein